MINTVSFMKRVLAIAASSVLAVSCGGSDEGDDIDDVTPTLDDQRADDVAHQYAIEEAGGEPTGCEETADEAESNAGCIYEVAFAGCLEGMLGLDVGSVSVEERFAQSPALLGLYRDARADCRL